MPYLLDSFHEVYGEDLAKIAVFSPNILTEYEVLNKWLLSIHDAAHKSKFLSSQNSNSSNLMDMDLSRISSAKVSNIVRDRPRFTRSNALSCSCNKSATVYVRSLRAKPQSKFLTLKIGTHTLYALADSGSEPYLLMKSSVAGMLQIPTE
jgi:hypothetical protein